MKTPNKKKKPQLPACEKRTTFLLQEKERKNSVGWTSPARRYGVWKDLFVNH